MQPRLSKAGVQLREQIDDCYPDRNRTSDGWIGDVRHSHTKSDHNPDADGWVRALDVTANLGSYPDEMHKLVEQMRKLGRKRLSYISLTVKSARANLCGVGRNTPELTHTPNTHTFHFANQLTKIIHFGISRC
jgi:hypothetical protein